MGISITNAQNGALLLVKGGNTFERMVIERQHLLSIAEVSCLGKTYTLKGKYIADPGWRSVANTKDKDSDEDG